MSDEACRERTGTLLSSLSDALTGTNAREDLPPLFEAGRLSWYGKYLKPAKRLLVDLAATKTELDKAIPFANELFLVLEARDHRVVIAPNS